MANWCLNQSSHWKRNFRKQVALRFNCSDWQYVRCCRCKAKASEEKKRQIEIHHVNSSIEFPELRHSIDNVVPLCNYCHLRFHKLYDIRAGSFIVSVGTPEDLASFLNLRANYILKFIE